MKRISSKIAGYRTSTIDINVMNCIYDKQFPIIANFIYRKDS